MILTDNQITNEISRVFEHESNGRNALIFLGPKQHFKPFSASYIAADAKSVPVGDPEPLKDARIRFVVSEGTPSLDLEIHETDEAQHIFINTIGDQTALQALSIANWDGDYRLPERIFPPDDDFKWNYDNPAVAKSYSLYTEVCMGLKPTSIFEIGVRNGYSAWAMLRGCFPGTIYHGIDIRHWEYASSMLHDEYPQMELRLARADSGMLTHLSRTYDLAHVDGNHSHEGALHDIKLCWGRAKYIIIDDVDAFCTVGSAVNEFLTRYPGLPSVRYKTQTGHVLLGPLPYVEDGKFQPREGRRTLDEIPGTVKGIASTNS